MELELKHVASLCTFRCKCMASGEWVDGTEYDDEPTPKVFEMVGFYLDSNDDILIQLDINGDKEECHISDCFPMLHPLSDLTKEIEVNGKRFNPVSELYEVLGGGYSSIEAFKNDSWVFTMSLSSPDQVDNSVNQAPYEVISKLFEWNFDVFGLIPEKLAANINELKQ